MPQVHATVYPHGNSVPGTPGHFIETREITHDLPADVIGECVTEAVHRAWRAGYDPARNGFIVEVNFT